VKARREVEHDTAPGHHVQREVRREGEHDIASRHEVIFEYRDWSWLWELADLVFLPAPTLGPGPQWPVGSFPSYD